MVKKYTLFKPGSRLQISNEKLKNHFESHFAAESPELPLPPNLKDPENHQYLKIEVVSRNEEVPDKEVRKYRRGPDTQEIDTLKTE